MTRSIKMSVAAVAVMAASSAMAGTLTTVHKPFTIAQEVLLSHTLTNRDDINVSRLFQNADYKATLPAGGSVNDPSMLLGMTGADLSVAPANETANIPAFCYADPTNTDTGFTAVTVYDHTEQDTSAADKLVFRSFGTGDAVSSNNHYFLMQIPNEGNASCQEASWTMYAHFLTECDPSSDAELTLWNANTIGSDPNALDTATDADIVDWQREFTITLAAKTFGEIKVDEFVDVRNAEAPIVDHAERTPNQDVNTTTADIHVTAPDTPLAYWLLPHSGNLRRLEAGTYNYYGDIMDLSQQADPIVWYVSIAPQGPGMNQIDYSVQVAGTNHTRIWTTMDGSEPGNVPGWDQGVKVLAWITNAGSLQSVVDCAQNQHSVECEANNQDDASGIGYMGVSWYEGLQNQTEVAINPTDFKSEIFFASDRTDNKEVKVWPFDYASEEACPAALQSEHTGYWQYNGYHAVVAAKNNERVSTVLRISNGLNQNFADRNMLMRPTIAHSDTQDVDALVGYNDQTNIARTADVYFRVTTEDGQEFAVYSDEWKIAPNSTKVVKLVDIMQQVDPAFTADTPFMGTIEIFVNNDKKNVTVDALENVKGSTDARTLMVNIDTEPYNW
jgi:hypothetical protein